MALAVVLISCGDEYYGPDSAIAGAYNVETEPSLSPDKQFIYYISTDSARNRYSGIYKAALGAPIRERVLFGNNYHSPVLNFDNNTLAFLEFGRIKYFNLAGMTTYVSAVNDSFESIIFLNESIIIGNRRDSLFSVNESNETSLFAALGWDPTSIARDTFICFVHGSSPQHYKVMKNNAGNTNSEVLLDVITDTRPRWPTFDPTSGRLAFSWNLNEKTHIFTAEMLGYTRNLVDSSDFPKPHILNLDMIIFTGPDGRFYQTNFRGTKSIPFVSVEG